MTRRRHEQCPLGAKKGSYDATQCRSCWHWVNTPGWGGESEQPNEIAATPSVRPCCGGDKMTADYRVEIVGESR